MGWVRSVSAVSSLVVGLACLGGGGPAAATQDLPRTFHVNTGSKKVFFITIDDGNVKSRDSLKFVKANRLPITAFLYDGGIGGRWGYFKKITAYGGSVQNHTMTHPWLTKPTTDLNHEICKPQKVYKRHFGYAPTLLRPPYGAGGYDSDSARVRKRISRVARSCGIRQIVMWDVVVGDGHIEYVHKGLRKGDIALLHFGPNLASDLRQIVEIGRARGLTPAPLGDYLK